MNFADDTDREREPGTSYGSCVHVIDVKPYRGLTDNEKQLLELWES